MLDFFRNHKGTSGVITIMLSLLLLPIYSLTALIMESARVRSAQEQLSEFNELGCMAILADYIGYLQDDFGLLAFESDELNGVKIEDSFSAYLDHCATAGGVDTLNLNKLFGISMENCSVEGMYTLADPAVLRQQIVQYGKFTIPAKSLMDITLGSLLGKLKSMFDKIEGPLSAATDTMDTVSKVAEFKANYDEIKVAIEELNSAIGTVNSTRTAFITALNSVTLPSTELKDAYVTKFGTQPEEYLNKINALISFMSEYKSSINTNYYSNNASNAGDAELTLTEQGALALNLIEGNSILSGSYKKKDDKVKYTQVISSLNTCLSGILIDTSLTDFATKNTTTSAGSVQTKGYTCYQNAYDELAVIKPWVEFLKGMDGSKWSDYKDALSTLDSKYSDYVSKFKSVWQSAQDAVTALESAQNSIAEFENELENGRTDLPENEEYKKNSILTTLVSSDLKATHDTYLSNFNAKYAQSATYRESMNNLEAIIEFKKNPSALDTLVISITKISLPSVLGITVPADASDDDVLNLYNDNLSKFNNQNAASLASEFSSTNIGYMDLGTIKLLFATFSAAAFAENNTGFNQLIEFIKELGDVLLTLVPADPRMEKTLNAGQVAALPSTYLSTHNYIYDDNQYSAADRAIVTVKLNDLNSYKGEYSYNYQTDIINGNPDTYRDFTARFTAMETCVQALGDIMTSVTNILKKFDPIPSFFELFDIFKELGNTIKGVLNFLKGLLTFIVDLITFIDEAINGSVTLDSIASVLLVNFYAADKFDSRATADNKGYSDTAGVTYQHRFDGAELEYLLGGSPSEAQNQTDAYSSLLFIRLLFNLAVISTNTEVMSIISGCTVAFPVVYIAWVLAETYLDIAMLIRGGEIALIKSKPITAPSNIKNLTTSIKYIFVFDSKDKLGNVQDSVKNAYKDNNGFLSLDYNGYLALVLMFYSDTVKLARVADLLQMRGQQSRNDSTFLLSNAKTYVRADLTAQYQPLLPLFSMSGNNYDFLQMRSLQYNGY